MPANTSPIFTLTPAINGVSIGAQNTKSDGAGTIGTDIWKAITADATNGSFVSAVRLSPIASVAATATVATVIRVFVSSVSSGATTSANTWLIAEQAVGIQTADQTTTGTFSFEIPINKALPAGYTILCTTHIANAANTSWMAVVFAGNY